jgi:lipoate-protein ligase B
MSLCRVYDLGIVEFDEALQLQDYLTLARCAGDIPDTIILLQHPSIFTLGRSAREEEIVVPRSSLDIEGITILQTDRGGSVTYHGPGQLVLYLIFNLKAKGIGIHQYVHNLEEVIIRTLDDFYIESFRDSRYPGVWVGSEKICALGIRVRRWCTKHGLALNVNTDLRYFDYIVPCGILGRGVTSMSKVLGYDVAIEDVASRVLKHCAQIFDLTIRQKSGGKLNDYYV